MSHSTVAERLQRRLVIAETGCHEWTGHVNNKGYGVIGVNGKNLLTHRLAWTLANGPIPDGLNVLHHCDNPPCCNVEGCLFLGTAADNNADMFAKGRDRNQHTSRTHCPQGHEFNEANTYLTSSGWRRCRPCGAAAQARYYRASKVHA